ncbi:universal stress protein [Halomarina ordinaria]|uniref:Universal stress protein n=1 Tax=Halomarina ordinaria TaxID=3033939 RepID=A0ABD5U858_9EURY|nr:universal stress protein [Halomarina sp. PSRA2]
MRHVLVPFDGSEPAERALDHVAAQFPDARVTLLTVIDPSAGFATGAGTPGTAEVWYESVRERAETNLAEARAEAEARGLRVDTVVETGRPAATIVDYAEKHGAESIVMGSHGRRGVSRLLLGSVAESVVRRSSVPVTVVP